MRALEDGLAMEITGLDWEIGDMMRLPGESEGTERMGMGRRKRRVVKILNMPDRENGVQ